MRLLALVLSLALAAWLASRWLAASRDARDPAATAEAPQAAPAVLERAAVAPPAEPARAPLAPLPGSEQALDSATIAAREDVSFPRVALRGRVSRSDGSPAEGAGVWARCEDTLQRGATPLARAWADARGRFELDCPGSGPFQVVAEDDDPPGVARRAALDGVGGDEGELELVLPEACVLRGTVEDALGAPVARFRLACEPLDEPARRGSTYREASVEVTGGRFEIALPAGEWSVGTRTHGEHAEWRETVRLPGAPPLRIVLAPRDRMVVRGTVVDAHGAPVSGAEVEAGGRVRNVTGESGRFEFVCERGDASEVRAQEATRSSETVAVTRESGEIVLRLDEPARDGRIAGRVVDGSGARVPGIRVLVDGAGGRQRSATTDARGEFALDVPDGAHRVRPESPVLRLRDPGSTFVARRGVRVLVREDAVHEIELVAPSFARVAGRVVLPDGRAPDVAWVRVTNESLESAEQACDAAGRFEIALDEGTREIVACATDEERELRSLPQGLRLVAGELVELELALHPTTRVRASTTARADVEAYDSTGRALREEPDGEFLLPGPGPYLLRAVAANGRTFDRVLRLDGAPDVLDVELHVE